METFINIVTISFGFLGLIGFFLTGLASAPISATAGIIIWGSAALAGTWLVVTPVQYITNLF